MGYTDQEIRGLLKLAVEGFSPFKTGLQAASPGMAAGFQAAKSGIQGVQAFGKTMSGGKSTGGFTDTVRGLGSVQRAMRTGIEAQENQNLPGTWASRRWDGMGAQGKALVTTLVPPVGMVGLGSDAVSGIKGGIKKITGAYNEGLNGPAAPTKPLTPSTPTPQSMGAGVAKAPAPAGNFTPNTNLADFRSKRPIY